MRAQTDLPVHDLIAKRWSPYVFDERLVPNDDIRSIFEAARWAPSSYNEQPWRFIVATKERPDDHERLVSCLVEGNQAWARQAPVLCLGVIARNFERNGKPNKAAEHDLGIAAATLTFEATARGLYVHQMIGIQPDKARAEYGIPEGFDALTGLAIGYHGNPADAPPDIAKRDDKQRERRSVAQTVFGGSWGQSSPLMVRSID